MSTKSLISTTIVEVDYEQLRYPAADDAQGARITRKGALQFIRCHDPSLEFTPADRWALRFTGRHIALNWYHRIPALRPNFRPLQQVLTLPFPGFFR